MLERQKLRAQYCPPTSKNRGWRCTNYSPKPPEAVTCVRAIITNNHGGYLISSSSVDAYFNLSQRHGSTYRFTLGGDERVRNFIVLRNIGL
jgi:hypothetical protein